MADRPALEVSPFAPDALVDGLEQRFPGAVIHLQVAPTARRGAQVAQSIDRIAATRDLRQGIVLIGGDAAEHAQLEASGLAGAAIGCTAGDGGLPSATVDVARLAERLVEHAERLDAGRIVPFTTSPSPDARALLDLLHAALPGAAAPIAASAELGAAALAPQLSEGRRPTLVVCPCAADWNAVEAAAAIAGRRPGTDVFGAVRRTTDARSGVAAIEPRDAAAFFEWLARVLRGTAPEGERRLAIHEEPLTSALRAKKKVSTASLDAAMS